MAQQGVRKVLDVKFHPEGLPQLVSCSNEVGNRTVLGALSSQYFLAESRNPKKRPGNECDILSAYFDGYLWDIITVSP